MLKKYCKFYKHVTNIETTVWLLPANEKYPGVKVEILTGTIGEDFQNIL